MSLTRIKKIQILAHAGIKLEFLSSLQEEGLVQVERSSHEELGLTSSAPETSRLDHELYRLSHALDFLSRWEEKSLGKKLLGRKPQIDRKRRGEVLAFDYKSILDEAEKLEQARSELESQIRFLEKELEFLDLLRGLEVPLTALQATETAEVVIGILPLSSFQEFQKLAAEAALYFSAISQTKRSIYLLLIYSKKEESSLIQSLKDLNFSQLYFTAAMLNRAAAGDRVMDLIGKFEEEKQQKAGRLDGLKEEGRSLAASLERLMLAYDVLQNEREKLLSARLLGETESIFYLEGWVRSSDIPRLKDRLRPYSGLVEFFFRDPLAGEEPPVALENPKAWKPFEIITRLYGLPQPGTMDPTLALAPFFFLFVGITVSEAGYGLLVALLSLLLLRFAKPARGFRQFLQLLLYLGVSTVILGTLIGGWFGFPIRKLMVLDPLQKPLSFLALSLGLGFVQVWFGTFLNMISGIKNRDYLQALFVQGGWLVLLPNLALYGITRNPVWGLPALAGAAGIVFFASPRRNPIARLLGGLYSLYDISRYLADILSYSRLLALGLATSVIAMVVNTLCHTALKIPAVGWLLAALIFLGGHLFNLGISFLGGFVHSMRLQFVEFFSKFFKSGGRPFEPFSLEGKYIEFL